VIAGGWDLLAGSSLLVDVFREGLLALAAVPWVFIVRLLVSVELVWVGAI